MIKDIDKYVPLFFDREEKLQAFINEWNKITAGIKDDVITLNDIFFIEKVPAVMLEPIGVYFNAGLNANDTDRQKRQKIVNAIAGHKLRSSFNLDVKFKIDIVAGGDSKIIRSFDKDDWILVGDGLTPPAFYWAALGTDGIDDQLGISLIGAGDEIELAGTIYIDTDNDSLTNAELDQIELNLNDTMPAYYRVFLGYINISGQFIIYREL